jgi:ABC-type oligopeptide transport system substrate-binding subunit
MLLRGIGKTFPDPAEFLDILPGGGATRNSTAGGGV